MWIAASCILAAPIPRGYSARHRAWTHGGRLDGRLDGERTVAVAPPQAPESAIPLRCASAAGTRPLESPGSSARRRRVRFIDSSDGVLEQDQREIIREAAASRQAGEVVDEELEFPRGIRPKRSDSRVCSRHVMHLRDA
jgi:hypothetical protein